MAEFILKDWYGKEQAFDKETIYVKGADGELIPFREKATVQPLSITENGTYEAPADVDGYSPVTVNVPAPEIKLQEKTITENGEYTADSGFDGLSKVLVNIAASGASPVMAVGKKYNTTQTEFTITHGLGVIPDIIIVFLAYLGNNPGNGTAAYIGVSKAFRNKVGTAVELQTSIELLSGAFDLYSSSNTDFGDTSSTANYRFIKLADENTFTIPASHLKNCHYSWLAIGGLTE